MTETDQTAKTEAKQRTQEQQKIDPDATYIKDEAAESIDEGEYPALSQRARRAVEELKVGGWMMLHKACDVAGFAWMSIVVSALLLAKTPKATAIGVGKLYGGGKKCVGVVRNTTWLGSRGVLTVLCAGAVISSLAGLALRVTVNDATALSGGYMLWVQSASASLFGVFVTGLTGEMIGS